MATALREDLAADQDLAAEMRALGERARAAARVLATTPRAAKDRALRAAAESLRARQHELLAANAKDMAAAQERGLRASLLDRLALDAVRVEAMAAGLEAVAGLADPVGAELARWQRPNGLDIARVRVPLGVIGVIYESRPNVTADAGALCLKAGNAAILRGGSESFFSSRAILRCLQDGLRRRRAARGRVAVRADHGPGGGRHHADHDGIHRRDRAARRPVADRTGAAGKPDPGVRAPRRHLPRLSPRRRRHRDGAPGRAQRQDAPHLRLRRGRDAAGRSGGGDPAAAGRARRSDRGGLRSAGRCRGAGDRCAREAGERGRLVDRISGRDHCRQSGGRAGGGDRRTSTATARTTPTAS